jgi:lysophospholipase L1-like esterase
MRSAFAATTVAIFALAAGAAGCDDEEENDATTPPEPSAAQKDGGGGTVVAALGDSITAGSPGFDPNPEARLQLGFGDDEQSTYEYWAARANPGIEFLNCGVFGERTDQIAQRLAGCAAAADAIVIQGGINDIAQGRSVEDAAADLRRMVVEAKEMGLAVAVVDVLPWNNGHPAADEPIRELNELIAGVGRDEGVPVLPFHDTLEDPAIAGLMKQEWTADGDHPSVEGYRRLGEIAFRVPG